MREITNIQEIQLIALGVLKHFKNFCDSHDISFMLAYGTLLGAVRHKGFIPWDDDVDIMMHRSEYNKLIKHYNNNDFANFKLISIHNNREYFAPLAKMYDNRTLLVQDYNQVERIEIGVYIDIFIIDSMPDSRKKAVVFYKNSKMIRFLWGMSVRKLFTKSNSLLITALRIPVSIICKTIGFRVLSKWYDTYSQNHNKHKTNTLGVVVFGEGYYKEVQTSYNLLNYSKVYFEGVEYDAPFNTHIYLRQMYGEYSQIPEEKDRIKHRNKVFYK